MSSSESEDEDFVFYRDRKEWNDITPIKQDDGPYPVVSIAYSEKFIDVFDYFRAILKKNEISDRAFDLVTDAITLNAANYTVWHFRRVLLQELKKDLRVELDYITDVIREQPKNYQVWYHRGIIVKWLKDSSFELDFTREMLHIDAKNYHCWQHRQLVLNHFKLWEGEVELTTILLEKDLRNNSAWNQRYYAIVNTTSFVRETMECEVGYAIQMIKKAPNNESAWNYLKGILSAADGLHQYPALKDDFEKMLCDGMDSPYLLSFLVDYYEEDLENNGVNEISFKRAKELCAQLSSDVDVIRKEYWDYMSRSLNSRFPVTWSS
eukprot:TCONS_00053331-protein